MTDHGDDRNDNLRDRAEQLLSKADSQTEELTLEEVKALVHDLRVHQVELELQNEELRNIQKELRKVTANYAHLYHNAPTGYLTVDSSGSILQANNTFGQMVGVENHRLNGTSLFDLIHKRDKKEFISRFRAFFRNPRNKNMEIRMVQSEYGSFEASLEGRIDTGSDAPDEDKNDHDQLLLIVNDISNRKQAELEIRKQKSSSTNHSRRHHGYH